MTNKFKTSSTIAATLAVASALSGCGLFGGSKANATPSATNSPSGATVAPIESATPTASPEAATAPSKEAGASKETDKSTGAKNTESKSTASLSKQAQPMNFVKNAVDPDENAKKACAATWGTWVNGTGCTWPVVNSSTTTNTLSKTESKSESKSESKPVELTPEQKRVLQLNQEIQSLSAKRVDALQKISDAYSAVLDAEDAYQTALENEQKAKDALAEATSTLLTNPVTLEEAKANVGAAEGRLAIAQENYSQAKATYDAAITEASAVMHAAYADADAAKDAAINEAETVRQVAYAKADSETAYAKAEAQHVYDAAVAAAEQTYNSAVEKNQAAYDAAVAAAKATLDSAINDLTKQYNTRCDAINQEYADAVDAAQKAYDEAKANTADEAYNNAVQNLTDAINAQAEAIKMRDAAKSQADKASDDYAEALEAKQEAEKTQADAKSVLDQANADLDAVKAHLAELGTEVTNARNAEASAKTIYDNAVKAVADAEAAQSKAKEAYDQAKANAIPTTGLVAEAQKKLDEANATLKAAQEQYAKGSLGFFEANQTADAGIMSDKAVELLDANIKDTENGTNGMGDGRGVVLGDERSATSLENMKRSMYILEETNLLRKQEGQSELRVNDHAMALSQVSVDIMTKWEHTQDKLVARYGESLAPSTGENLAAGTPGMTIEDTNGDGVINISMDADSEDYIYGGWYTREKAVYEYKQTHPEVTNDELDSMFGDHQTGHYLNYCRCI